MASSLSTYESYTTHLHVQLYSSAQATIIDTLQVGNSNGVQCALSCGSNSFVKDYICLCTCCERCNNVKMRHYYIQFVLCPHRTDHDFAMSVLKPCCASFCWQSMFGQPLTYITTCTALWRNNGFPLSAAWRRLPPVALRRWLCVVRQCCDGWRGWLDLRKLLSTARSRGLMSFLKFLVVLLKC